MDSRSVYRRRRLGLALVVLLAAALVLGFLNFTHDHGGITHPRAWIQPTRSEVIQIESKQVGRRLPVAVILPRGYSKGDHLPILVLLHGRGLKPQYILWSKLVFAVAGQGERAPIVVVPYGGDHSYWHNRDDGDWGDYVTDEVIPRVASEFGGDRGRVAIGGFSMGGYGAFNLVRENPGRFCALGGHSPAIYVTGGQTAPGAFDDAADFAANDVFGQIRTDPPPYLKLPIWLDVGDKDPLRPYVTQLAQELKAAGADVTFRVWKGGHGPSYWESHFPRYLRFYEHQLENCSSK